LARVAQVAQVEMVQPQMVLVALLAEPQHLVVFCLVSVEALEVAEISVELLQAEPAGVLLVLETLVWRRLKLMAAFHLLHILVALFVRL
jgi:hypothetical protein